MEIKFDIYFKKNLGTLFKDNEVDLDGIPSYVDLDLTLVDRLEVNFRVGSKKYTDLVNIIDINEKIIQIPFKPDVIQVGLNEFEIVAYMVNGDIKTSQTYTYHITEAIGRGDLPGSGDIGPSGEHIHINLAILDTITQAKIDSWNNKAEMEHTHSEYLTELPTHTHSVSEIDGLDNIKIDLSNYYTKTETNKFIDNKADKVHTHSEYADKEHTHSEYLTELPTHTHSEYLTEHQDISHKADKVNTYTKTETDNKISQEIEKIELKEGPQGPQGDTPSIDHLETAVSNKINEIETRFSALTVSQQQSSEVIDARGGETSLKARLDKDSETVKNVYTTIEAPYVCVDSSEGHLKGLEILGNTVQDIENLSDIRSVGDKVEDKELYEIPFLISGKNLFNVKYYTGTTTSNKDTLEYDEINDTFKLTYSSSYSGIQFDMSDKIPYFEGKDFITSFNISNTISGLKSVSYLQGLDANGKTYYFNSANGFTIPKGTLVKLIFKVIANNSSNAVSGVCTFSNLQIEEGTTITSYEPYQENKLTILSPTQLEKVGDVADRIICKDGIWGVEKKIASVSSKDLNFTVYKKTDDVIIFNSTVSEKQKTNNYGISNKLNYDSGAWKDNVVEESIGLDSSTLRVFVKLKKSTLYTLEEFNNYKEDLFLLYQIETPRFIPLPQSQQIQLKTFAGKTSISFKTEIEGTIKAQVPKTLGATVNIHHEQIDNLYKEVDSVKEYVDSELARTGIEHIKTEKQKDYLLEGTKYYKTLISIKGLITENANYEAVVIPNFNAGTYTVSGRIRQIYAFSGEIGGTCTLLETIYNSSENVYKNTFTVTQPCTLVVNFFVDQMDISVLVDGDEIINREDKILIPNLSLNDKLKNDIESMTKQLSITIAENKYLSIQSSFGSGKITQNARLDELFRNGCFNLVDTVVTDVIGEGNRVIHDVKDSITPVRTYYTLGANHGYPGFSLTANDKSQIDVGSVWTDGVNDYVMVAYADNTVTFAYPYTFNSQITGYSKVNPIATLTHKSGATHTSDIAIDTFKDVASIYKIINKHSVKFFVDNNEISLVDGTYLGSTFIVKEEYNIVDYKAMQEYLKANVGSMCNDENIEGTLRVSLIYKFTESGDCTIYHSVKALSNKVRLQNCGFVQSEALSTLNDYTINRILPGVKEKSGINFGKLVDMSTYNSSLLFYKEDLIDPEQPCNRSIDIITDNEGNYVMGHTIGYICDKFDGSDKHRLSNDMALWDMRDNKKSYPVGISNMILQPGEYLSFACFRNYLSPYDLQDKVIINKIVEDDCTYIIIDSTEAISGSYEIKELLGKKISIVNSRNFTLGYDYVDSNGISYSIGENGGSAVLKVFNCDKDSIVEYATKEELKNVTKVFDDCITIVDFPNLLDTTTLLEGSKFDANGNVISNSSYGLFEHFIKVDRSKSIIYLASLILQTSEIALLNKTGVDVCLYKDDKTAISRVQNVNTIKISDYPEMGYLRVSVPTNVLQARKVGVFYDELPIEWNEYGQYYTLTDNVKNNQLDEHIIDCWGDSLTNGVGANGNGYPLKLAALLGDSYTVNKYGNGGERCVGIAARQGGYDIYLKPFTLPKSGAVAIEIYNNYDNKIVLTNKWGMNPCYVNGVQCEFSINGSTYYLEQKNGNSEVVFDRPVKLNTLGSMVSKKHINIIWAGTNNVEDNSIGTIIESIRVMINNLNHDKYIIIGLTSKSYHNDVEEKNKQLWANFGNHFLDIRRYILDYGLEDLNITPSDNDNIAIVDGEIPPSLLTDDVHFNESGYELISRLVYKKGQELGYW